MTDVEEKISKRVGDLKARFNNCDEDGVEVPKIINDLRNYFGSESIMFKTLERSCYLLEYDNMFYDPNEELVVKAFVDYVVAYCRYEAERDGYVDPWVLEYAPRTPRPTLDNLNKAINKAIEADRIKNRT